MSETKEETEGPDHPPRREAAADSPPGPAAPALATRPVTGSSHEAPGRPGRAALSFRSIQAPVRCSSLGVCHAGSRISRVIRVPGRRVRGSGACVWSSPRARLAGRRGLTAAGWGGVGEPHSLSEPC